MDDTKTNIEQILAERMKLDEILKTEFTKKITVMFTDIKGSTSFYEQRGDLDGRMLVHRHNELVLPVISDNRGMLIKTIGDATMSVYDDPANGVNAAIQIEKRLKDYNASRPAGEQIHVRIGLNTGMGIVEEKDVFGDVVNVASRVESLADGGEIMVTEDTYREVKSHDEFIFRFAQTAQVKGKKEPLKAYRVVWSEEDLHVGVTRGKSAPAFRRGKGGVFVLDASVAGQQLKISAYERAEGEERAVKNYREQRYNAENVKSYTRQIIDVLNRANRRGKIGSDLIAKLKELGGLLFDELVPVEFKEKLKNTKETSLMISIDDNLVHIPWELLYDGSDFLCQRFSVGRSVSTRQAVAAGARALHRPLKMQILADPRGDLRAAYEEGVGIKDEIGSREDHIDISLKTTTIGTDYAKAKIRNFDIVHYAGHAEHNAERPEASGWLLKDGRLTATDVGSMAGGKPMPALVFSNACQTGQTEEWKLGEDYGVRIFGLANAFLLSGVQHYIGTFWEILDESGAYFARAFYRQLADGAPIGEAVRLARHELIQKFGEDTIVWASYMLYGDPTTCYVQPDTEQTVDEEAAAPVHEELVGSGVRGGEEVVALSASGSRRTALIAAGAGVVLVAGIAAFMLAGRGGRPAQMVVAQVPAASPAASSDVDARKRMDDLVSELAAQYRSGKIGSAKATADEWSSRPLTLVFMDVKAGDGGEKLVNALSMKVAQELQDDGRVQMVERELLSKLLEELKLSASSLADPATALKLGKLLSARVMVTGSIETENKGMSIMLRFIDTETSAVRKVLSVDAPTTTIDKNVAKELAKGINDWAKADFPIRGRILSPTGDSCLVNLGQSQGVKKGDRLEIVREAKKGTGLYAAVGEIEITLVAKDKSEARIVAKAEPVKDGAQVRIKL